MKTRTELIGEALKVIDDAEKFADTPACDAMSRAEYRQWTAETLADFALSTRANTRDRWVAVEERLPELAGWYEVTIQESNDLGSFRYTDTASWMHSVEHGDHWNQERTEGGIVIAWRDRCAPYTQEGSENAS